MTIEIEVVGGTISDEERDAYISYGKTKYPELPINHIKITLDGDYVDLQFTFDKVPFRRIRRITGYLVGTLDRFNDAKRTEVRDRLKHNL